MEVPGNSHCSNPHCASVYFGAESTKPITKWEVSYLSEFAVGHPAWMGELLHTPGWGELLSLCWDLVPLQAGPVETPCIWNETQTIGRGEKVRVLVWRISPPGHLLTPDSAASSRQYVWYIQPGQFLK